MVLLGKCLRLQIDFIRLKSYEDDRSTGHIKVLGGDSLEQLKGKVRTISYTLVSSISLKCRIVAECFNCRGECGNAPGSTELLSDDIGYH